MRLAILLVIFLSIPAIISAQTTWYVPDDFPTIQGAIADATVLEGDTVIVRPETYVENINFLGKGITLKSDQGPALTVIDGSQSGSVVTFENDEELDSVLEGFTITNGSGTGSPGFYRGGGIFCSIASPIITKNIIIGNKDSYEGGGIYCFGSYAIINYNTIIQNSSERGGGIRNVSSATLISNNNITENIVNSQYSDVYGGGIFCSYSISPTITNNIISGNSAGGSTSAGRGGGICCEESARARITNNLIIGNSADSGGGIHSFEYGYPIITNNTIYGNIGSGVAVDSDADGKIKNCILWGNIPNQISAFMGGVSVSYSNVQGGYVGMGNIDADPLFVDPTLNDFHLQQDPCQPGIVNPCVDSGSNLAENQGMHVAWTRTDDVPDAGKVDMGFHYGPFSFPKLSTTDEDEISATYGGYFKFLLNAGGQNANRKYLMLGTMSGTDPGFSLPGGLATMPINWDIFTDFVISQINTHDLFFHFYGTMNESGICEDAAIYLKNSLPSVFVGIIMHYAYCLNDPFNFASNPVAIEIVP